MKLLRNIKKYGPNAQSYLVIGLVLYSSYASRTVWPIIGFVLFLAVLTPLCVWMHRWNERENERICADFPNDPYIQAKYGKKR